MELQYVVDSAGNCTAVIVPIEMWNEILDTNPDLKELYGEPPFNTGFSADKMSKSKRSA